MYKAYQDVLQLQARAYLRLERSFGAAYCAAPFLLQVLQAEGFAIVQHDGLSRGKVRRAVRNLF
tara:strand:- start:635 stop:826 length:192 start_codon:yes stop_codon:yes gene_type:complete